MNITVLTCSQYIKNNHGLKKFFTKLSQYSGQKISLIFENNIFEEAIQFKNFFEEYDVAFERIVFENVTFKQYVRFIDIQCEELEFLYVNFEKGGGLKNRQGEYSLDIGNLIFKPFQVNNDFVIDLGNYANKDGFLETKKIGRIRTVEFENHKEGSGQVYFVGINQHTEMANFRNRILDKVSFQNCDLTNCYFLNAKVDQSEFRNCIFPEIRNHKYVNEIAGKENAHSLVILGITFPIVIGMLVFGSFDLSVSWIFFLYLVTLIGYVPLILYAFSAVFHPIEYYVSVYMPSYKNNILNSVKSFHHHIGVSDENQINQELHQFFRKSKKDDNYLIERNRLQQSYFNLIELYRQLKENFDKNDFQTAGSFFYSQRYMEMISVTYKKTFFESWVLNIHYVVNGFGERFIRPVVLLIMILILFVFLPYISTDFWKETISKPLVINQDYIATNNTPLYLLQDFNETKNSLLPQILENNQTMYLTYVSLKDKNLTAFLNDKELDANITIYVPTLKNDWHTKFYYSLSHLVLPFASENRQWFKEVSQKAVLLGYLENTLLWLFSGAFVLALYHRIKRGET